MMMMVGGGRGAGVEEVGRLGEVKTSEGDTI